jgi:hypothetical protein
MEQNKKEVSMSADIKPLFADEVNVNANIKVNVEKKEDGTEHFTKTGRIDLLFFDQFTKTIISRIVIDPYTAKVFAKVLEANASKMIEEIEKKELPPEVKERMKKQKEMLDKKQNFSTSHTYIG